MNNWVDINFTQVVDKISTNGKKIKQKEYLTEGKFPVIDQGQDYIGGYSNSEDKKIEVNTPVIVFGDHTKIVKLVKQDFVPGADGTKVISPKSFYHPKLLAFFINVLSKKIPDKGYARHFQFLEKENVPLLPQEEQEQLVSIIEQLFSDHENAIDNIKKAKDQLKVYRQSVLKYAFDGKLTNVSTIEWITLGEVCESVEYGTSSKSTDEGSVPVLRMGNIQNGRIEWDDLKYTNKIEEIKKYRLRKDDVLFNRTNSPEHVGKTAIYKNKQEATRKICDNDIK